MSSRILLIISARYGPAVEAIAAGASPRKDFIELARALDADVLDIHEVTSHAWTRLLARTCGMAVAQATLAFWRRQRYSAIFADGEHIGIPLAALLRLTRNRPRFGFIGHLLTTPLKRRAFGVLGLRTAMDYVLVHSTTQRELAVTQLGIDPARLVLVPYQVDTSFWPPRVSTSTRPVICSVGLEHRDYSALLQAVAPLPIDTVIAAGSRWSRHRFLPQDGQVPSNVTVGSYDYSQLRELYGTARFVVVPLLPILNQSGITSILEAMSMAKAVIVTAAPGQRDVVRGRLCTASGPAGELIGGPAAFGITGPLAEQETGLYVPAGDDAALRQAITYLLKHPDEAAAMGAHGRQLAEACMSIDAFVEAVAPIVIGDRPRIAAVGDAGQPVGRDLASGLSTVKSSGPA